MSARLGLIESRAFSMHHRDFAKLPAAHRDRALRGEALRARWPNVIRNWTDRAWWCLDPFTRAKLKLELQRIETFHATRLP